eukprot:TRINITY_DN602_c0_g2_i1.p1 TRINITY_DN602_c0_g2~~TRINITY_DN602_c0_g2_i1.p1  ORF type:complete len:322 (+),score=85.22 TRINITY_DN602_c0_g2_i1:104-967(+)
MNTKISMMLVVLGLVACSEAQGLKKTKGSTRRVDDEGVVRHKYPVVYSSDNVNWKSKGFLMVGDAYQVWFEGAFQEWDKEEVTKIVEGDKYYLRISKTPRETLGEEFIQLTVSVCELVNSAMSEHYHVIFSPHNDLKGVLVGVAPFGAAYTKIRSPSLDACTSPEMLLSRYETLADSEKKFFSHSLVVADRPPHRPATFGPNTKDEPIFQQPTNAQSKRQEARQKAESTGEHIPEEREQPETTWFQKYWLYIVIAAMFFRLQGAQPEPGAGGGGGGGAPAQGGGGKK